MPPLIPRQFGQQAEHLAQTFLKKKGYRIFETNYCCRYGEIDIVAKHKKRIMFVEVKARRTEKFGAPVFAVAPAKQQKISQVALFYLQATQWLNVAARFDVVSVSQTDATPLIEIVENSFELTA